MKIYKRLLYTVVSIATLLLVISIGGWSWLKWEYHLPSAHRVQQQFEGQKAEYAHFASLLQKAPPATFIDSDGNASIYGTHSHLVPEYRTLIRKIGAESVRVDADGSIRFALWGFGCAICSDSYMGVMYTPDHPRKGAEPGWPRTIVTSLESERLPQDHGSVASGLYMVPIEPKWYIYRLEIQE